MNILYLEDDAHEAFLITRDLAGDPDIHIDPVTTIGEALGRLEQSCAYDLILTDLTLPDGSGLPFVSLLRERQLPVAIVVLTGDSNPDTAVAAIKAGANDYLIKSHGPWTSRLRPAFDTALRRFRDDGKQQERHLHVLALADDIHAVQEHLGRHTPHIHLDLVGDTQHLHATVAARRAAERPYDAVLLVHHAGLQDLPGLLAAVDSDRMRDTPVVVLTDSTDGEVAAEALRLGAADLLPMVPGYLPLLSSALESACAHARLQKEQRALRESQQLFEGLFESAPDALLVADRLACIQLANRRAEEVFGWTTAELIGMPITRLVPESFRERHRQLEANYMHFGRTPRLMRAGLDLFALHKDGHEFPVEISLSPLAVGDDTRVVAAVRDITDRKRLEAEYLQAQKMDSVGRLVSSIAHDFNNILTVINGSAALAAQGLLDGSPVRPNLDMIADAGTRAAALTARLLAFSRKQVVQPVVADIAEVISGMEPLLRRLLGERHHLEVRTAEGATARIDVSQFEQVIMNLVVNARDAMESDGRIAIDVRTRPAEPRGGGPLEAEPTGACVQIAVSDTGCGMAPETLQRAFEPFFTTKGPGRGTGLGLPTVRDIVEQHQGRLAVDSAPGRGSTFIIQLPHVRGSAGSGSGTRIAPGATGDSTILVVEDQEDLRRVVRLILERSGYAVLTAANGEEALSILRQTGGRVHLVFTDIVMPDMGGRDLGQALRVLHPEVKILYTSGYPDDAFLDEIEVNGNTQLLLKPFTMEQLRRKVQETLSERSARHD